MNELAAKHESRMSLWIGSVIHPLVMRLIKERSEIHAIREIVESARMNPAGNYIFNFAGQGFIFPLTSSLLVDSGVDFGHWASFVDVYNIVGAAAVEHDHAIELLSKVLGNEVSDLSALILPILSMHACNKRFIIALYTAAHLIYKNAP